MRRIASLEKRVALGWQPARRLATAAVRYKRGGYPLGPADCQSAAACQAAPQERPCLVYTYAQIQAVLPMNRVGVHFHVAHPMRKYPSSNIRRNGIIFGLRDH